MMLFTSYTLNPNLSSTPTRTQAKTDAKFTLIYLHAPEHQVWTVWGLNVWIVWWQRDAICVDRWIFWALEFLCLQASPRLHRHPFHLHPPPSAAPPPLGSLFRYPGLHFAYLP